MMKKKIILMFFVALMSTTTVLNAASVGTGGISTAFSKNSTSIGVVLGSGSGFGDDYLILGLGVGYYLVKGLEIGIDAQYWAGGDPTIFKLSPQIRYVFTQPKVIKPFVGVFYRRTFIDSDFFDDRDSFGYRAGAYFSTNNRVFIGAGIVYEEYKDCAQFVDCSNTYPEILFTVSF